MKVLTWMVRDDLATVLRTATRAAAGRRADAPCRQKEGLRNFCCKQNRPAELHLTEHTTEISVWFDLYRILKSMAEHV